MNDRLRHIVQCGNVSHAFVICGEDGMAAAAAFGRALLCENPVNGDPCGMCTSCNLAAKNENPDIIYTVSQNPKRDFLNVEETRLLLVRELYTYPLKFKRKVFIVENADKMSVQAQNILLKSLEEPPFYVVIILVSKTLNFLPTVMSRVVAIQIQTPDGHSVSALNDADYILANVLRRDPVDIILFSGKLDKYKSKEGADVSIYDVLDALIVRLRDRAVRCAVGSAYPHLLLDKRSGGDVDMDAQTAVNAINAVLRAQTQLKANCNFALVMELMLLSIANNVYL